MSIASQITRLQGVKADILDAIADKGVVVPAGSDLAACPALIAAISSGGNVTVRLQAIVPVSGGIRVCDAYGYVGGNYFGAYYPASYNFYNNFAIVVDGADFSQSGLGTVTLLTPGTDTIGGRTYRTVTMPDGKTWLAENLDFKFSGCDIGPNGSPSSPAAWYYNNDEALYGIDGTYKCGLLYNNYAFTFLENNKDTLIPGWRIPSYDDWWSGILPAVGGASTAATVLKSLDDSITTGYPSGWNGTNVYGFSCLPAGRRHSGQFTGFGTSTEYFRSKSSPYTCSFGTGASVGEGYLNQASALPIRLVKDP